MSDGNSLFQMAEIALKAHCYKDAANYLKESLKFKTNLTKKELDVFSLCYKKTIDSMRNAIFDLDDIIEEKKTDISINPKVFQDFQKAISEHRYVLVEEATTVANEAIELIDSVLIPTTNDGKCTVFLNKLKGDYYRYLCENAPSTEIREVNAGRAKASYEAALMSVSDVMVASDPLYLNLILNYAVFQYEILGLKDDAIDKLDSSFNEAIRFLEELNETQYKEATMMLQLIRDNIGIWRAAKQEEATAR